MYPCFCVCFVLFLCFYSQNVWCNRKRDALIMRLWSFVTGSCRHWCTKLPKRIHMSLTIASLNVRGLRDNTKRREMFTWLRAKHFSIYMLQEVHCTALHNRITCSSCLKPDFFKKYHQINFSFLLARYYIYYMCL